MLPSLRGGNGNPGHRELMFGEVDDVLAAIDFAEKGVKPVSNASSLPFLTRGAGSAPVKTLTVEGVDHFGVLAPITRLLATKINADSGSRSNIAISQAELAAAVKARP
ncbi:MAG TPA: hypothetical protein VK550_25870 [Polyangiaceae bacterium]|nr:hypothetical protein [Polyangiaceae bacterium]